MKLEIILNGIGSVTVEDEVNRTDKVMRRFTSFVLDELNRAVPQKRRMGFESTGTDSIELADEE